MSIDDMQFGSMPGKRTTGAIIRHATSLKEAPNKEKKKLYYAFVDLEKEFDRVGREVVRWALRKLGVDSYGIVYRGMHCS